ncbi:MAG: hypothetical protein AB7V57_23115, partial [Verrucomicrobiales bacterium]
MLDLIHVWLAGAGFAEAPDFLPGVVLDVGIDAAADDQRTLGSADIIGIFIETTGKLPGTEGSPEVVGILLGDMEMVVDVA